MAQAASPQAGLQADTLSRAPSLGSPKIGPPRDVSGEIKTTLIRHEPRSSRHVPNAVKRVVWYRDRGQCAFVSATGRRCIERNFLELHHIQPYALDGPATAGNISLRCRRHNQYESEVVFGTRSGSSSRESAGGEKGPPFES